MRQLRALTVLLDRESPRSRESRPLPREITMAAISKTMIILIKIGDMRFGVPLEFELR